MSIGKKLKIKFKKNKTVDENEQASEQNGGANAEETVMSQVEDNYDNLGQSAESSTAEQSSAAQEGTAQAKAEASRLEEFLARDVDFSGLENSEQSSTSEPSELDQVKNELKEANDRYLRAIADLENFRKHSIKERSDLLKYQGEKLIVDLLEVVDNFELAMQHKDADLANLRMGLEMIHKQMLDLLERWGVKAESGLGQAFDPVKYSAISKVPSKDAEPGSIVAELKKPYYYKDKLLRVGQVVVAEAVKDEASNNEAVNSGTTVQES